MASSLGMRRNCCSLGKLLQNFVCGFQDWYESDMGDDSFLWGALVRRISLSNSEGVEIEGGHSRTITEVDMLKEGPPPDNEKPSLREPSLR